MASYLQPEKWRSGVGDVTKRTSWHAQHVHSCSNDFRSRPQARLVLKLSNKLHVQELELRRRDWPGVFKFGMVVWREAQELREVIFRAWSLSSAIVQVSFLRVWFYSGIIAQHLFLDIADKQTGIIWPELTAHCDTADLFVKVTDKNKGVGHEHYFSHTE